MSEQTIVESQEAAQTTPEQEQAAEQEQHSEQTGGEGEGGNAAAEAEGSEKTKGRKWDPELARQNEERAKRERERDALLQSVLESNKALAEEVKALKPKAVEQPDPEEALVNEYAECTDPNSPKYDLDRARQLDIESRRLLLKGKRDAEAKLKQREEQDRIAEDRRTANQKAQRDLEESWKREGIDAKAGNDLVKDSFAFADEAGLTGQERQRVAQAHYDRNIKNLKPKTKEPSAVRRGPTAPAARSSEGPSDEEINNAGSSILSHFQ